jgi:hypothetical protein
LFNAVFGVLCILAPLDCERPAKPSTNLKRRA